MLVGRLVLLKAGEMLVLTHGKGRQQWESINFSARAASWRLKCMGEDLMVCNAEAVY